jgi:hypothetical protein
MRRPPRARHHAHPPRARSQHAGHRRARRMRRTTAPGRGACLVGTGPSQLSAVAGEQRSPGRLEP